MKDLPKLPEWANKEGIRSDEEVKAEDNEIADMEKEIKDLERKMRKTKKLATKHRLTRQIRLLKERL